MSRRVTIRPSYRAAVAWIAHEDNAGCGDPEEEIRGYISTHLVADLFGTDLDDLARDIARERRRAGIKVGE
ncbi:hypothetical protein [Roseovarius sp. C03]|uniref:hypothetical protein n=1 Tax=Roseovarius sp. C03 TaxID=3449222 RepID=UPI003EDC9BEC